MNAEGSAESLGDDPIVGSVLSGRYEVLRRIGQGGMGSVYEGRNISIDKRIVIKVLHDELARDAKMVERFRREAKAATAIDHEHIVDVTDLGELPDGSPFIVMEFLDGRSLGDLIEAEVALRIDRAIDITRQICSALAVAHGLGIVHRDIKPDNIFLVRRGRGDDFVKVLDFGISKIRDPGLDANLTKTGAALGTPAYMPPEQAQGLKSLDHRADIFAVGVMLFEMLAGRLPFEADTYAALLLRMMTSPPPRLTELRGDVPEGLAAVVDSTMAKQPEDRPQSMAELSSQLAAFAAVDAQPELLDRDDDADRADLEEKTRAGRPGETEMQGGHDPGAAGSSAPVPSPFAAGALRERDADETAPPPTARQAVPSWAFYLGAALIVVAVAGWWLLRAPAQRTVEAPAAAEVRVRVRVSPADATILLAGTVFPNPMDAARPRSLDPISLVIERDGYRTMRRTVVLDQDRSYDFELAREVPAGVDDGALGSDQAADDEAADDERADDERADDGRANDGRDPALGRRSSTRSTTRRSATTAGEPGPAPETTALDPPTEPATSEPTTDDGVYRGRRGAIRDTF